MKTDVIERVSTKQDVHDAICHHVVIEHGTITIALIIDVGIVTSSRYVIVLLICHSTVKASGLSATLASQGSWVRFPVAASNVLIIDGPDSR